MIKSDELLQKTIGEMSGIEFVQLIKVANDANVAEEIRKLYFELKKKK